MLSKRGRFLVAEPAVRARRRQRITLDGKARERRRRRRPGAARAGQARRRAWSRTLGRPDVARDVLEGLMLDRGLRRAFPRRWRRRRGRPPRRRRRAAAPGPHRAAHLHDRPRHRARLRRRDLGQREGDAIRVWVHIADVSAFVRPGSAIEREAYRRATSVYVPGAVEPMLPEALSNHACSLVPGVERLAVTVEMELTAPTCARVVPPLADPLRRAADVRAGRRIFAGEERAEEPWAEPLAAAREVAAALRERRAQRGSLEVESSEPRVRVRRRRPRGGVQREKQTESHSADRAADDRSPTSRWPATGGARGADALPRARAPEPAAWSGSSSSSSRSGCRRRRCRSR